MIKIKRILLIGICLFSIFLLVGCSEKQIGDDDQLVTPVEYFHQTSKPSIDICNGGFIIQNNTTSLHLFGINDIDAHWYYTCKEAWIRNNQIHIDYFMFDGINYVDDIKIKEW